MSVIPPAEARSLGLKLILVGGLAFLLWVPAMLIYALVWDRSTRADTVTAEIIERAGGRQSISGPVVIAPARIDTGKIDKNGEPVFRNSAVAFTPKRLHITAKMRTAKRARSIYEAAVYDADIVMAGTFDFGPSPSAEGPVTIFWERAEFAVTFASSDHMKGVRDAIGLTVNGRDAPFLFEPGIAVSANGENNKRAAGVSARFPLEAGEPAFDFTLTLPLSGGGGIYFSPVGEETKTRISADWSDPGFQGAYLPDERAIDKSGFKAEWAVPYLAREIPRAFFIDADLFSLQQHAFGVELVAASSPYQSVNRALKYALMFLGIVFLTFFLFEATMGGRAHPAQYILLGATQVIFYLLVLAFSEHIGFGPAFFLTAGATVVLSGWYAATVFHSKTRGVIAFAAFSAAYGLIYLLMKSEDYALLIGSVTAFAALSVTMFVTRNLDWYGGRKATAGADPGAG